MFAGLIGNLKKLFKSRPNVDLVKLSVVIKFLIMFSSMCHGLNFLKLFCAKL